MGTDKWLAELEWNGKKELAEAKTCIWRNQDDVAGYVRSARELTQVKIRGAGHLAPIDQPAHVQDMLHRFIFKKDFCK
jgi:cathepsin A (carboxypeptidase C)